MNEQQIEQLLAAEEHRRQSEDAQHLERLGSDLTADLPQWAQRRRVASMLLAVVLLVVTPMAFKRLLPAPAATPLVACNIDGQENAVVQCANNILT